MSGGFEIGEVVVCVDDRKWPNSNSSLVEIKVGGFYRIVCTDTVRGVEAVQLAGVRYAIWYQAARFRKLPRADASFTEQMRACKPHHAKTPVSA